MTLNNTTLATRAPLFYRGQLDGPNAVRAFQACIRTLPRVDLVVNSDAHIHPFLDGVHGLLAACVPFGQKPAKQFDVDPFTIDLARLRTMCMHNMYHIRTIGMLIDSDHVILLWEWFHQHCNLRMVRL